MIYFSIYSYLFYSCFHSSSYSFFRSVSLPFIYCSEVSVFQTLILSILSINLPLQFVSPFLCFCLCFLIFQTFIGLSACLLVWLVVCLPAFHSSHLPCVAFSDLQPIFYIHELETKARNTALDQGREIAITLPVGLPAVLSEIIRGRPSEIH